MVKLLIESQRGLNGYVPCGHYDQKLDKDFDTGSIRLFFETLKREDSETYKKFIKELGECSNENNIVYINDEDLAPEDDGSEIGFIELNNSKTDIKNIVGESYGDPYFDECYNYFIDNVADIGFKSLEDAKIIIYTR